MKHKINLKHLENMSFETHLDDHKLLVDVPVESGGDNRGPSPKRLMLVALAGCTGMDIVSLFKKMRIEYSDLNIRVEANVTEEHPKHYDSMKLIYEVTGDNLSMAKVEKAVKLSFDQYCGVAATYKKGIEVSYEIVVK